MSQENQNELPTEKLQSRITSILHNFWSETISSIKSKFKTTNYSEKSLDIALVVFLICLAMFIRVMLSYTFREEWGYGEGLVWNKSLIFNISFNDPIHRSIEIRGFADFGYYYLSWVEGWYEGNWYPYQWHDEATVMDFYSYPPVFLYFLVLTWRPGMSNFWLAFPMVLADAACAGVIYLILKEIFKGQKARGIGLIGGILMAIAPINVIYDGIYWLNPGPVTLLTIIAFYFAIKKKWWQAFFWLAVATMTKQNALFFAYPIFMVMLGEKVRNKPIKEAAIESIANALLFVFVGILLSIPWLFISPYQYVRHMLFPGRSIELRFDVVDPVSNDCVSFAKSLEQMGFPDWILAITSFGNYSMLWMILSASVIAIFMLWRSYNNKMDNVEFFNWIAMYTIFTHIFMPRGVYKFYTAYFVPMILVALLGSLVKMTAKEEFLPMGIITGGVLFLGFNIWLIIMQRFPVPFYLFMVALFIGLLTWFRAYFSDRKKKGISNERFMKFLESKIGS
ncbi:MAG: hypothetical protein EAX90_10240 [Candidatus Heimdallarchaeota archaeon]|nr:hypothetical protein [Candidatus Heimdallarchaeota archaeon]